MLIKHHFQIVKRSPTSPHSFPALTALHAFHPEKGRGLWMIQAIPRPQDSISPTFTAPIASVVVKIIAIINTAVARGPVPLQSASCARETILGRWKKVWWDISEVWWVEELQCNFPLVTCRLLFLEATVGITPLLRLCNLSELSSWLEFISLSYNHIIFPHPCSKWKTRAPTR